LRLQGTLAGREWMRRGRAGEPFTDRSSRPDWGRKTTEAVRERVLALRREWRPIRQIATVVRISPLTAARICRREGLSRLRLLEPPVSVVRYEKEHAGELLHIDIKRLGRFDRVGHRITRKRSFGSKRQGFELVYVATDDASHLAYAEIHADERSEAACTFLKHAVGWFAQHEVQIERVMTDNRSAFVGRQFGQACRPAGITHKRIRPYTPRTTARPSASSRRCYANGRIASPTTAPTSGNNGSRHTCTSTTTIGRILRSRTMRRSVAWPGTTS
jgi:transposase InsO family protein